MENVAVAMQRFHHEGLHANAVKAAIIAAGLLVATASFGKERKYDPGASDTEIRIGQTMPYSGPVSAFAVLGKVQAAYFRMINDRGGISGRRINLISYDDAATPSKTVAGTWRKGGCNARQCRVIRAHGSDGRFAGRAAEDGGCRSPREYGVAEIRGADDQEGGRTRLETGSSSRRRLVLDRRHSDARGS
jgi:hypothetical protein